MSTVNDVPFGPGRRVYCTAAGLTGEAVARQGAWIGVRLVARSQQHRGFDDSALRVSIGFMAPQFHTKDLSLNQLVLNAHPFAGTLRNYHAMLGRHLSDHQGVLGIRRVPAPPHARGASWESVSTAASSPGQAGVMPGFDNARRAADAQIEAFLRSVGIDDPMQLQDKQGRWCVGFRSVMGIIRAVQLDQALYLRVCAEVMTLPPVSAFTRRTNSAPGIQLL